ncbi:hypothetical protein D3C73_1558020 [compost metagenome]
MGYQLTKDLELAIGARNLFDVYPERQAPASKTMVKGYGVYSPYGFTGGYYFGRLTYTF